MERIILSTENTSPRTHMGQMYPRLFNKKNAGKFLHTTQR